MIFFGERLLETTKVALTRKMQNIMDSAVPLRMLPDRKRFALVRHEIT